MVENTVHILGAGISGLTLAYELAKKGASVRIYEKSQNVGGLARTEEHLGVSYDCGPHLFHTNNPVIQEYWLSLLGDKILTPNLFGANYKDGKVYEYPLSQESIADQFTPEQIDLIKKQLNDRDLSSISRADNYAQYVKTLAGDFLHDMFFKKYPEKLWGIKTEELSAKFAPRRIEIREESRAFHSGAGKWAAVLQGGCGVLASALEDKLRKLGVIVEFNSELTSFDLSADRKFLSSLTINNQERVIINSRDIVVSTIPVNKLAGIMGIDNSLWYRCIKIACLLVNRKIKLPGGYDWLYFDSQDLIFHRVTLQNSFSEVGIPDGFSILSCEVAYSENDAIDDASNESVLKKCIADLIKVNLFTDESLVEASHIIDAGYVYPGISNGYESEVARVNAQLDCINNLYRHGALAEFEYSDLQVLTAKSIDLAVVLSSKNSDMEGLQKKQFVKPLNVIKIDNTNIGSDCYPYIIAEAGLNHNGDLAMAKKLVEEAKKAGANAIKFQTYSKGRISKKLRTSSYYEDLVDSQESLSDLLDRIILPEPDLRSLFDYAGEVGITIFSTPFDIESFQMLERLGCSAYKISSMDLVNLPLIKVVAQSKKPMIVSTGMSSMSNVDEAVRVILAEENPNLILMHCVSTYPCPPAIANLPRMKKIRETFDVLTGYSDHTIGTDVAIASVALGACIVEKHFTLDRKFDGPDHNFSLLPSELNELVVSAKKVYDSKIDRGVGFNNSEINTALNLRRSIFFSRDLAKGSKISTDDLVIKSPGVGMSPKYYDQLIGAEINTNVFEDEPALLEHFIAYRK